MKNSLLTLITLVMISLSVVSCGGKPVLTGIKVETTQQDQSTWMSFSAELNLGSMTFASVSVPIHNPRTQTPIGQLELASLLSNKSLLRISINLSEAADLGVGQVSLPNGNMVPMIANNPAIAIDVGNGAKVYLILSKDVTAVGVAVPIGAFDSIGRTLPGLNFFPIINSGNVIGTAGIFTGLYPGQNGIAVIADVSKVVAPIELLHPMDLLAIQGQESSENIKLDYRSHTISKSKRLTLMNMINQLDEERTVLKWND